MVQENYTGTIPNPFFSNWTDVDRQTELNDDDGTLTGLAGTFAPLNQTISVNKDSFFNAPIETDQCRSNLGVDPSAACTGITPTRATAKTSPYDHLTTVVYPECALGSQLPGQCGSYKGAPVFTEVVDPDHPCDSTKPALGCVRYTRYTAKPDQGGIWSKGCGGPYCFGVPIYRQFLVGDNTAGKETEEWQAWASNTCSTNGSTANCQFPFARMAGTGDYQRSVMTLNGGTYYIDTTVSQLTQRKSQALGLTTDKATNYVECDFKPIGNCEPRSVNAFQGGQKYYVFFVYAKYTTQQTYQIYVGTGFNPDTDVNMIQMKIDPPFTPNTAPLSWPTTWDKKMIAGPDGQLTVLQVKVDMNTFKTVLDPTNSGNGTCKPASFCKSDCTCNLNDKTDPRVIANPKLMQACTHTCSTWAKKDLDCPADGCLGFSFKLPQAGFVANDTYHRPKPLPFPSTGPTGTAIKLVRTKISPDSGPPPPGFPPPCFYPQVPGTDCPVPFVP